MFIRKTVRTHIKFNIEGLRYKLQSELDLD